MCNRVGTANSILVTYRWLVNEHAYHMKTVSRHAVPQDQIHFAFGMGCLAGSIKMKGGNYHTPTPPH